tara:strand:- start:220 stop:780 length:561 start_codon:yes stop_codon:yes gene_type:complete
MSKQLEEIAKYEKTWKDPNYKMGEVRKKVAKGFLDSVAHCCTTYLDVGCGRGEMLDYGETLGMEVSGVEPVGYLTNDMNIVEGVAWDIPFEDNSFDLVTMFDVIEHLLPEDTDRALQELGRVTGKKLFIAAANFSSMHLGVQLHINIKTYDEWDAVFRKAFPTEKVIWLNAPQPSVSQTWLIEFDA